MNNEMHLFVQIHLLVLNYPLISNIRCCPVINMLLFQRERDYFKLQLLNETYD